MYKKTLRQILNSECVPSGPAADLTPLQVAVAERLSELPATGKNHIPVVFPFPETRLHTLLDGKI